jgi:hypothetical protein
MRVMSAFIPWQKAAGASAQSLVAKALDDALNAAERADDAIVFLIRAELQGRGGPIGGWQPVKGPDTEQVPPVAQEPQRRRGVSAPQIVPPGMGGDGTLAG